MPFSFCLSWNLSEAFILSMASCAVLERMLLANILGTFCPLLRYPASSNAAMAVVTRVSISTTLSSHPALRAISSAEFQTVERNLVIYFMAFQTC